MAINAWDMPTAERLTSAEMLEWLYVYNPAGQQLARFHGTADIVDLSDELKGRARGRYGRALLRDHRIVHNHPVSETGLAFPPSPSDLAMAIECDLAQLTVVSGNERFLVRRPGDDWPLDESLLEELLRGMRRQLGSDVGANVDTLAWRIERQLRILQQLDEEGWINYVQTQRLSDL